MSEDTFPVFDEEIGHQISADDRISIRWMLGQAGNVSLEHMDSVGDTVSACI